MKKKNKDRIIINFSDLGKIDQDTMKKWKEQLMNEEYYIPKSTFREKWIKWIRSFPKWAVFLCKLLYPIIDIGGFVYLICGGFLSLFNLFALYQKFTINGWEALFSVTSLYIIAYLIILFIIYRIRFWMYYIKMEL